MERYLNIPPFIRFSVYVRQNRYTEEDLDKEMDWFYGKRPREAYLMLAVSEIIHHEGQIAAILDVEKRMKGT